MFVQGKNALYFKTQGSLNTTLIESCTSQHIFFRNTTGHIWSLILAYKLHGANLREKTLNHCLGEISEYTNSERLTIR